MAGSKWIPVSPIPAGVIDKAPAAHPVRGKPRAFFRFHNTAGLVGFIYRFDGSDGSDRDVPLSYCYNEQTSKFEWRWMCFEKPRPLYGPLKLEWQKYGKAPVLVMDDPAAVDAACASLAYRAVAWVGGIGAIGKTDWSPLFNQDVILLPTVDTDTATRPNMLAAKKVAEHLAKQGCAVRLVDSEGQPEGWNIGVALEAGAGATWNVTDLMAWIEERKKLVFAAKGSKRARRPVADIYDDHAIDFPNGFNPDDSDTAEQPIGTPRGFLLVDHGLFYQAHDANGEPKAPMWICGELTIPAIVRNSHGLGWGKLLTFKDPDGHPRTWILPHEMLQGDGNEYRRALADRGLDISPSQGARQLLTRYLQSCRPQTRARCTDRTGWHDNTYVMPHRTIGPEDGEAIYFQDDGYAQNARLQRGTLAQWREKLAELCIGNSRLAFVVSCAFASMLLELIDGESGGIHFSGDSSEGKTTLLLVAASVFGNKNYLQRWRSTDNGLEAVAKQHSGALLCLDEIAQMQPNAIGDAMYMLANGQGKLRAGRTGSARPVATWKILFISTGEVTLADHMQEANKRITAGQSVRMLEIPADAEEGLGTFDELRGFDSKEKLLTTLNERVGKYHGVAAPAFLENVVDNLDDIRRVIDGHRYAFCRDYLKAEAQQQAYRAVQRFSLIAAAGEIATAYGITGWPEGEAMRAAAKMLEAWTRARGGLGNQEKRDRLRKVKLFIERYQDARFPLLSEAENERDGRVLQQAGYRRVHQSAFDMPDDRTDFLITPEVFKTDVCAGSNVKRVVRDLVEAGCLEPSKDGFTHPTRVPGRSTIQRFYVITHKILELDLT